MGIEDNPEESASSAGSVEEERRKIEELRADDSTLTYHQAHNILHGKDKDFHPGGGKPQAPQEKKPDEYRQRHINFRLSLIDQDKPGPFE